MPTADPILLVEDSEDDAFLMKVALEAAGVTNPVVHVSSSPEAIVYLNGNGKYADRSLYPQPKIVFLDLNLAVASGLEVLKWLRAQERLKTIVTIVLSVSNDPIDVLAAYKSGANAYLMKPATPEQFVELLRNFRLFWLESNQFYHEEHNPPSVSETSRQVKL